MLEVDIRHAFHPTSFLYVSHSVEEVMRLGDTMVLPDQGRIAAAGTVEALSARLDLRLLTESADAGAAVRGRARARDVSLA